MKYQEELYSMIFHDLWMMEILRVVRDLKLDDSWIGAGFIRNKVWDVLHGFERTALNDIDVLYYNSEKPAENEDLKIEQILNDHYTGIDWSVKNQARMHIQNKHFPYINCEDAVAHWPETATAVAVRLNFNHRLELIAPYGLDDLFHLQLRRSPLSTDILFQTRLEKKQWQKHWPQLFIEM
jgi:uncharacterized protein